MKYEYENLLINELLKQKGNEIDKKTLETATFNVCHYEFGHYTVHPDYKSDNSPDLHIHIAKGVILNVYDLQGSELSIDFTVYEMDYPSGYKNHILCNLDII